MLRISNSELKLTSHGYHFDDHGGRKYVRVYTSLTLVRVQVKLQPHKELHVIWRPGIMFTDNWINIIFPHETNVMDDINDVLNDIWFV